MVRIETNERTLALAGGGARGAYQAGAMLALAKEGITFNRIAGTSVGTLNGAFYAQGSGTEREMEELCSLWRKIGETKMVQFNQGVLIPVMSSINREKYGSWLKQSPLKAILDKYLDYKKICNASKKLIIATIPSYDPFSDVVKGASRKPVYFVSEELAPGDLKKALLAATAIPFAFPSISVKNEMYTDAGLSTPIPSKILFDSGAKFIASIFLSDKQTQNRLDYPHCTLFQIRPSKNITEKFYSTLDFSSKTINYLLELGYNDASASIAKTAPIRELFTLMRNNQMILDNQIRKLKL